MPGPVQTETVQLRGRQPDQSVGPGRPYQRLYQDHGGPHWGGKWKMVGHTGVGW